MTQIPPPRAVEVIGVNGLPEIRPGDDLAVLTARAVDMAGLHISGGEVVVYTQKIVSKAEGRLVRLDDVTPSERAREWANAWQKDPRVVELVLREAVRIVRMERGVLITETRHGFVCAHSGVDTSNAPPGWAVCLPVDPDTSAQRLCAAHRAHWGTEIGVVISDTFGRPWREAQVNVAIGVAGVPAILDYRGQPDSHGRTLRGTTIALADELAAAAELVMGKTLGVPVALIRGLSTNGRSGPSTARDLVRASQNDLFR